MKRALILVAATFSLASFSALAGGNCIYGHKDSLADATDNTVTEKVDPILLALLKKQQGKTEKVKPIITYN